MIAVAAVQRLLAGNGPFRASVPQQEPAETAGFSMTTAKPSASEASWTSHESCRCLTRQPSAVARQHSAVTRQPSAADRVRRVPDHAGDNKRAYVTTTV